MNDLHREEFLGLPPNPADSADAAILPVPLEKTVSYGEGTREGPQAMLDASMQIETFDEETLVDFEQAPRLHTARPVALGETVEDCLDQIRTTTAALRGRFVLSLGGEHTLTYPTVMGLVDDPAQLTIVQIDAHADLADQLDGLHWSHGTVMRRLWEQGCRLIQIGIRSLSRPEYELIEQDDRIECFFAHRLSQTWPQLLDLLRGLQGDVYLSLDVDGLDPSIIPQTGTPQPGGLDWWQTMDVIRAVAGESEARLVGADVVELTAAPHPPGCDLVAAKLVTKILGHWWQGKK